MRVNLSSMFVVSGLLFGFAGAGCGVAESDKITQVRSNLFEQAVCVFGSQGLTLGDRAVATGLAGSGEPLDVGNDARLNGTTIVSGSGTLRDRSRVTGDLNLTGLLTRGFNTVVTGVVRQRVAFINLPVLFSQSIPAGTDAVNIPPGANVSLRGGGYGSVVIGAGSTVRLSGTYDVTSWTVNPDAHLIEDPPGSGIQINSVGDLSFADRVVLQATDPVNVSLYSNGQSVSIGTQAAITGILDGPFASIAVGSRARFNGCAGGRRLTLDPDAQIVSSNPTATLPLQSL